MISIGYIIGTSIAGILALVALAILVFGIFLWRSEGPGPFFFGLGGLVVVAGLYTVFAFPPFDMDYHTYAPVKGTVESVDKRMVSDGDKGMSEKFVVRLEGNAQQYGCLDTRCAAAKVNEPIELACIKVYQFYGTPGYDCEFVSAGGRT